MKKLFSLALVCLAFSLASEAQESFGLANSSTGTTLNTLTKVVVNAGAPQAQIMATTDTSGAVGITTLGNGTSGTAIITRSGIAPCVFDNTTVAGDFVQIASGTAGDCHDAGSTRPTSGQIIGIVIQTGGSAGTYNVLLDKSILPGGGATTAPICNVLGSSDTLTAAGTFATTCSISGLVQGSFLEIRAHGIYTTGATASPIEAMQVNAGGTAGICTHTGNQTLATNLTNVEWDVVCYVHILTTGAPGTATTWGVETASITNTAGTFASRTFPQNAATQSYTTNTAQTVSIQENGTLVAGESFTLQDLVVRNY